MSFDIWFRAFTSPKKNMQYAEILDKIRPIFLKKKKKNECQRRF